MKPKSYHSRRNLYFPVIFFLFIISQGPTATGQSIAKTKKDFDKLNRAYQSDKLSSKKYLDSTNRLTDQYLSEGIHFKTRELTDLLSLFKEIAWSKKEYGNYRENYYVIFLNNASMFEETGASMYYAEKAAQEAKKNGKKNSLIEVSTKSQIYMEEELYDKVITQYINEKPYLKSLPELLRKNQVNIPNGMEALTILSAGVIEAYIKTRDTAAVYQTALLVDQIGNAIKHKLPVNRQYWLFNDFFMLVAQHYIALFEGNQAKVAKLLDSLAALKTTYKDQATGFIDENLFPWRVDHYLATNNADSAGKYINMYETYPSFAKNKDARLNEYKARLKAIKGDLHGSNKWLNIALADERKVQAKLMAEMTDLLYAYTEAENTKIDLQQSEIVKKQRSLWLVIISTFAAFTVLTIYLIMVYRDRKAKEQVEALNSAANMQIIAMEEAKHQAVREEQQRLGQDLHDGLSSSIAAYRNQIEVLSMDIQDITLKNKFIVLGIEMTKTYETVRNKSHEWYSAADEQQELSFEKQIRLLTNNALPDSRYHKTIQIDDNSFTGVSTDTRIALLRIIQEAVTNIIKHAKAKNVGILIYEEEGSLILTINDDGIGLNENKSSGKRSTMGLESIRRRVQYLNGEIDINSNSKGTEITISIPLVLA